MWEDRCKTEEIKASKSKFASNSETVIRRMAETTPPTNSRYHSQTYFNSFHLKGRIWCSKCFKWRQEQSTDI